MSRIPSAAWLALLLTAPTPSLAAIDPDCHEGAEARRCLSARLADARIADFVLTAALSPLRDRPRFTVQFVRGERLDRLLVSVQPGPARAGEAAESRVERVARALASEFEQMQAREAVQLDTILRHVESVEVVEEAIRRVAYLVPCHEGGCPGYRRTDAEEAARLFRRSLEEAGWAESLVGYRYRKGRERDSDELEVILRAGRGAAAPTRAGASRADAEVALSALVKGMASLPRGTTERVLRGVGSVRFTGEGFAVSHDPSRPLPPPGEALPPKEAPAAAVSRPALAEPVPAILDPQQVAVETTLPAELVHRTIRRTLGLIRYCQESHFRLPALKGEITVTFDVRAGLVERPRIADSSTVREPEFSECVLVRIRSLTFPSAGEGGRVKVTYRLPLAP